MIAVAVSKLKTEEVEPVKIGIVNVDVHVCFSTRPFSMRPLVFD